MNRVRPRVTITPSWNRLQRPPHRTVTLKTRPKSNLPYTVPFQNPPLSFGIRQLVPQRTTRRVPEPVQRHPRRLQMPLRQIQILLNLIQHCPPTGMNAKMLKRKFKIRNIRLHFHLKHFSLNKR
ncbi:hypothetical protein Hanom_Chr04g00362671 [Helianthus anomalus]